MASHIVLKDSDSSTTILASYNRYWLVLSPPFRRESCSCVTSTIVPERFWHKLNYFFVLSNFWKNIYYLCQFFYKIRNLQISTVSFQLQAFKFKNLRLRHSGHTSLSHKLFKNGFVRVCSKLLQLPNYSFCFLTKFCQ